MQVVGAITNLLPSFRKKLAETSRGTSLAGSFLLENSAFPWIKDEWETICPCFLKSGELK